MYNTYNYSKIWQNIIVHTLWSTANLTRVGRIDPANLANAGPIFQKNNPQSLFMSSVCVC